MRVLIISFLPNKKEKREKVINIFQFFKGNKSSHKRGLFVNSLVIFSVLRVCSAGSFLILDGAGLVENQTSGTHIGMTVCALEIECDPMFDDFDRKCM